MYMELRTAFHKVFFYFKCNKRHTYVLTYVMYLNWIFNNKYIWKSCLLESSDSTTLPGKQSIIKNVSISSDWLLIQTNVSFLNNLFTVGWKSVNLPQNIQHEESLLSTAELSFNLYSIVQLTKSAQWSVTERNLCKTNILPLATVHKASN
jgi:hypothetical protein